MFKALIRKSNFFKPKNVYDFQTSKAIKDRILEDQVTTNRIFIHDLGNILTALDGNIELLSRKLSNLGTNLTELKELENINSLIVHAQSLTKGFVSKSVLSLKSDQSQQLDLKNLVEDAVKLLNYENLNKGLQLSSILSIETGVFNCKDLPSPKSLKDLVESKSLLIKGQETVLKQLLVNVLNNGLDAVKDSQEPSIKIRYGKDFFDKRYLSVHDDCFVIGVPQFKSPYATLEIIDNGCGMKKETIKNIFSINYTEKITGNGLGLASTKKIVDDHCAVLVVTSQPSLGSTFKFYFNP